MFLVSFIQSVDESFAIELVIGWSENTRTVIRQLFTLEIINITDTLNVLKCNEFRSFWISWHDGMLRVGSGYTYANDLIIEAKASLFFFVCVEQQMDGRQQDKLFFTSKHA